LIDYQELCTDVASALALAEQAAQATPDGGSCSADMVHIPVGKAYPIKRRSLKVYDALAVGGPVTDRDRGMWRGYLLIPPGPGQASARLAACEAMAKALKQYGATVYYARD
jgi:hypothetical protein